MKYIIIAVILIFIITVITFISIIYKGTKTVSGKIIKIEKKMKNNIRRRPGANSLYKNRIVYSYSVDGKMYTNSITDEFDFGDLFYKKIKPEEKEKKFQETYNYKVEKEDIIVRYKVNNPKDSNINGFLMKGMFTYLTIGIIFCINIWSVSNIIFIFYTIKILNRGNTNKIKCFLCFFTITTIPQNCLKFKSTIYRSHMLYKI